MPNMYRGEIVRNTEYMEKPAFRALRPEHEQEQDKIVHMHLV